MIVPATIPRCGLIQSELGEGTLRAWAAQLKGAAYGRYHHRCYLQYLVGRYRNHRPRAGEEGVNREPRVK